MKKEELNEWHKLSIGHKICKDLGFDSPADEYRELLRLNHLVMEQAHAIHNDNMLGITNSTQ